MSISATDSLSWPARFALWLILGLVSLSPALAAEEEAYAPPAPPQGYKVIQCKPEEASFLMHVVISVPEESVTRTIEFYFHMVPEDSTSSPLWGTGFGGSDHFSGFLSLETGRKISLPLRVNVSSTPHSTVKREAKFLLPYAAWHAETRDGISVEVTYRAVKPKGADTGKGP